MIFFLEYSEVDGEFAEKYRTAPKWGTYSGQAEEDCATPSTREGPAPMDNCSFTTIVSTYLEIADKTKRREL